MTGHVAQALSGERPFPGLRPFDFDDHDFFFGRSDQIASLYRLLDRNRFIAIVGSSGCGKSSLTRAGLLHVLEKENAESKLGKWVWCSMRPGEAPLDALTDALNGLRDHDDEMSEKAWGDRIATRLHGSSFGIAEALIEIGVAENDKFVLVVDQFEELFRYADQHVGEVHDKLREARVRNEAESFVELLLEARRSSKRDIRVLITMRSDFIGDCASFDGLPEAVSATQFLVPGMTRDQYVQVICEPTTKAGAEIDPKLVQQLLNDAGDEADELPVLQHCLLQLWEKAGAGEEKSATAVNGAERHEIATAVPAGRHIELDHYDQIDKIAGALSQHADKILRGFREEAVEAVFRALSEFKDGRAIRRPLQYRELREESGIVEGELEPIVDRFRADDCSFLVTSPPGVFKVKDDTVIDVGHEALLRRWQRIRGVPGATGDSEDKRPIGWLRQERKDGQRYQILLSMLDSEDPSRKVDDIKRHRDWWNERTRTARWAERYGGKYDAVAKLLRDGWAHRQAVRRRDWALGVIGALILLSAVYYGYSQALVTKIQSQVAQANFARSVEITTTFLNQVLAALNRGQINVFTAREMEKSAQSAVGNLQTVDASLNTIALEVRLNVIAADILNDAGALPDAMERAERAKKLAQKLSQTYLDNDELQTLLLNSALRLGDALEAKRDYTSASLQFGEAQSIAQKLADRKPDDNDRQSRLAFTIGKVGEMARDQDNYEEAIKQFLKAMDIATGVAAKYPDDPERQAYVPSLLSKIADMRTKLATPDIARALEDYKAAVEKQEALLIKFPGDIVVRSNLALSHRGRAEALVKAGSWNEAFEEFKSAIAIREKLVEDYRDNATQVSYLAADHSVFANTLIQHGKTVITAAGYNPSLVTAFSELQQELVARKRLVEIDPKSGRWSREMAATQGKIDDLVAQTPSADK